MDKKKLWSIEDFLCEIQREKMESISTRNSINNSKLNDTKISFV